MISIIISCCLLGQVDLNPPTVAQIQPDGFLAYQLFAAEFQLAESQSRYQKKHPALLAQRLQVNQLSLTLKKSSGKNQRRYTKLIQGYRKTSLAKAEAQLQVSRRLLYTDKHPQVAELRRRVRVLKNLKTAGEKPKKRTGKNKKKR